MQPHAPDVTGTRAIALRLKRRLTTFRGTHPWWRQFGTDLHQYRLSKMPAWRIAKDIDQELAKDEQVEAMAKGIEVLDGGRRLRIVIAVLVSPSRAFQFTMDITQAAGTLVALQEVA
jgi:hypothetical protein